MSEDSDSELNDSTTTPFEYDKELFILDECPGISLRKDVEQFICNLPGVAGVGIGSQMRIFIRYEQEINQQETLATLTMKYPTLCTGDIIFMSEEEYQPRGGIKLL